MPFPITNPALQRALAARGYLEPTPVQQAVLERASADSDLLVSAQTGSGKTLAYGLALAPTILGEAEHVAPPGLPMVLVITPTRELALQVHKELDWLYEFAQGKVIACVGGMDPRREQRALAAGCHIVVGTPGRLQDHIRRGNLNLSECRAVVLDEADEMLDLGFREELEFILDAIPDPHRTLLFSATIAKEIVALARTYQRDAIRIDTAGRNQPHEDIEYRAILIAGHEIETGWSICCVSTMRAAWCSAPPGKACGGCMGGCRSAVFRPSRCPAS
jgi:ATP-dependent RNA helicase DeaD